jgi:hypothetical protein
MAETKNSVNKKIFLLKSYASRTLDCDVPSDGKTLTNRFGNRTSLGRSCRWSRNANRDRRFAKLPESESRPLFRTIGTSKKIITTNFNIYNRNLREYLSQYDWPI